MPELAAWDSFFVMIGSAAGALIGLQFVVVTLVADKPLLRVAEAGAAFATPTIVHFGAALLLSALLLVSWQSIIIAAAVLGPHRPRWIGVRGNRGSAQAEAKRIPNQSSRTGYFMLSCLWRRTQCSRYRHSRLPPTHERPCLALERRRCCCFSWAFTTPGTVSSTMYLSISRIQNAKRR